jgi:propanol-preferring alcohol dehydrogenase
MCFSGKDVKLPRVPGHEIAGEVESVGPDTAGVSPGDRCVVYFYLLCGSCRWCRSGRETLCSQLNGFVGVAIDGGFAEYVNVPVENLIRIPDGVDYVSAAIATDAVATPWHCLKERVTVRPGDDVLIIGAGGGVGIHAVQIAQLFGARVTAVDISDEKLALAREYGADVLIDGRNKNWPNEVRTLTDEKGVEACVDFVGMPETVSFGVRCLSISGTLVIVGVQPGEFALGAGDLVLPELTVTGTRYATRQEVSEALDLIARGAVKPVVTRIVALEEVESVFEALEGHSLLGRAAVTFE